jgi:hypothetical protein
MSALVYLLQHSHGHLVARLTTQPEVRGALESPPLPETCSRPAIAGFMHTYPIAMVK